MSLLTDTWRGLVQRRLWPVALVLLAALAAVPIVLSSDPSVEVPAPAPASAVPASELAAQPIVVAASPAEREEDRHVVGAKKNPFKPAPVKKAKAASAGTGSASPAPGAGTTTVTVPSLGGGSSVAGVTPTPSAGGYGGGAFTPAPSVTAPAPEKKKAYELYSLTVRWGRSEAEERPASNLRRLRALPSTEDPAIIYLGVLEDQETAVFMVDAKVTPVGDGACKPSKVDCQTIHLQAGETEFFDVTDDEGQVIAQYQLDLLKIRKASTTSAKAAKVEAKGGRKLLRERLAQAARYDYDASDGVLEKLPPKAVEAKLAKLATVAEAAGL